MRSGRWCPMLAAGTSPETRAALFPHVLHHVWSLSRAARVPIENTYDHTTQHASLSALPPLAPSFTSTRVAALPTLPS